MSGCVVKNLVALLAVGGCRLEGKCRTFGQRRPFVRQCSCASAFGSWRLAVARERIERFVEDARLHVSVPVRQHLEVRG